MSYTSRAGLLLSKISDTKNEEPKMEDLCNDCTFHFRDFVLCEKKIDEHKFTAIAMNIAGLVGLISALAGLSVYLSIPFALFCFALGFISLIQLTRA